MEVKTLKSQWTQLLLRPTGRALPYSSCSWDGHKPLVPLGLQVSVIILYFHVDLFCLCGHPSPMIADYLCPLRMLPIGLGSSSADTTSPSRTLLSFGFQGLGSECFCGIQLNPKQFLGFENLGLRSSVLHSFILNLWIHVEQMVGREEDERANRICVCW